MNAAETRLREELDGIEHDRAVIAHERSLLESWERSVDRYERALRRALEAVDETGQTRLINPLTNRPHVPVSTTEQRAAVVSVFRTHGPAHERRISQKDLERYSGMSSGMLSRAVRDLEAEGKLHRVGRTPKRSPIWSDVRPDGDPA